MFIVLNSKEFRGLLKYQSFKVCPIFKLGQFLGIHGIRLDIIIQGHTSSYTYLQVIQTQFKEKHIQTLEDAMIEAKYVGLYTGKSGEQSSKTQA